MLPWRGPGRGIDKEVEPWYGYFVKICANINCKRESRDGRKDGFASCGAGLNSPTFAAGPQVLSILYTRHDVAKENCIIKAGTPQNQIDRLIRWLQSQGVQAHLFAGEYDTTLTLVGQTSRMNIELLAGLEIVQEVKWVSQPFQCCSREFRPQDTVISLPGSQVRIGGGSFCLIAGPCSVESPEQILEVAKAVQAAGAQILRGGAFKPRTSPYAFQGLGAQGIQMLVEAKRETGLPIITEVMSVNQLPLFEEVDILQIGARNMQNYDLLREVGRLQKPVLLKRGLCATLTELLMSAEYILSEGNQQVMLCERGIRTYETNTRNTLDLAAVPMLKELSHLPVLVDPSHGTGLARLVEPMALAAAAAGADGVMVEVHNDPPHALCDGAQALTPEQFAQTARSIRRIREALAE